MAQISRFVGGGDFDFDPGAAHAANRSTRHQKVKATFEALHCEQLKSPESLRFGPVCLSPCFVPFASLSPFGRPGQRPNTLNVLILFADDWRHDTLAAPGTPRENAASGCLGEGWCPVHPQLRHHLHLRCEPGHALHRPVDVPAWEPDLSPSRRHGVRPILACSAKAGYHTGHIGKWHNGKFPAENFDFGREYSGTHWIKQPDGSQIHVTKRTRSMPSNSSAPARRTSRSFSPGLLPPMPRTGTRSNTSPAGEYESLYRCDRARAENVVG